MANKSKPFHSLSRRIVAQFCIFTLVLSAVFGMLTFALLYTLEDNFIERDMMQEVEYLTQHYQTQDSWPEVRSPEFSLHFAIDTLPDDMRGQLEQEPQQVEFYGAEGRHYHLYRLPEHTGVMLLAEVSKKLLVRPVREGILTLLFISTGLLMMGAICVAWLLGRSTAKPLKKLADLVDDVAIEHIPDEFAHEYPNNEIGTLARALENSMQQIKLAINRERNFTRDVSHELRTPVAIIKNAVEVYKQTKSADKDGFALLQRIDEAATQMEQTVTTLLHLAREEHTRAEHKEVALLPLIEQSIIERGYLLDNKPVEVEVADNCQTTLVTQEGMLKVLLDNLLSNAFQYTEQGKVKASFKDGELTIEDTGPGIEPNISHKITEPAVKGSQSTGYGFGLSIVKRLCEHQGWRLTVESDSGTRISVGFVQ